MPVSPIELNPSGRLRKVLKDPDMTVYYLGVPDTSPEVLSEKEMENYFEKALERLKK